MKKRIYLLITLIFNITLLCGIALLYLIYVNLDELPDYNQLKNYKFPVISRFYAANGMLLEEYAKENRSFIPIQAIPNRIKNAFISAEDKNFYRHHGIDTSGILRAIIQNVINFTKNKKYLVGGSTITQQVVKNFLLTNEQTLHRKIKEALLALRISKIYSKDRILELYLNQIYLGSGAYGISSAALIYFNKSVNELTLEEAALLAALPKSPNNFNPRRNYKLALKRRNWIISRMIEDHHIDNYNGKLAMTEPIILHKKLNINSFRADFFAESVRQEIANMYGKKSLYENGLYVRTTLQPDMQEKASKALRNGLINYDHKNGYRGHLAHLSSLRNWQKQLAKLNKSLILPHWYYAIVLNVESKQIKIGTTQGQGYIKQNDLGWAFKKNKAKIEDIFTIGDLILVEHITDDKYALQQIPEINGGIVVIEPYSGKILAMVGGFNFNTSKFNRVNQAMRQTGSVFKTFVYLLALEKGYTPSTIINDEPIEIEQGPNLPLWKPKNYHGNFLGPTTLRRGLELSRNTMVVSLANMLGIEEIVNIAQRFDISQKPPALYSIVLGAMETTLLKTTTAYAMIVNGGKKIKPTMIEKIQDRHGKTIYTGETRKCYNCLYNNLETPTINKINLPRIVDERDYVTDPRSAYQIVSILEGAMQHTRSALPVKALNKTLGGKTGTTTNNHDAWFVGFSSNLVVGVYVGYDIPRSLGKKTTGAALAQPIFVDFMKNALNDTSDRPFRIPKGIKLVKVDYKTGKPSMDKKNTIYEAFKYDNNIKILAKQQKIIHHRKDHMKRQRRKTTSDLLGLY